LLSSIGPLVGLEVREVALVLVGAASQSEAGLWEAG
jgi:hypothetical protein